jgi:hypothetical protein
MSPTRERHHKLYLDLVDLGLKGSTSGHNKTASHRGLSDPTYSVVDLPMLAATRKREAKCCPIEYAFCGGSWPFLMQSPFNPSTYRPQANNIIFNQVSEPWVVVSHGSTRQSCQLHAKRETKCCPSEFVFCGGSWPFLMQSQIQSNTNRPQANNVTSINYPSNGSTRQSCQLHAKRETKCCPIEYAFCGGSWPL